MTARTPDRELELLQEVQQRARVRKITVLTRLKEALDLPIDEHLDSLAGSLSPRKVLPPEKVNGGRK